jgi:signal transduction histidine kinase
MKKIEIKEQFGAVAAFFTWLSVFGIVLYWLPNASDNIKANAWLIVSLFILYIGLFGAIIFQVVSTERKPTFFVVLVLQLLTAFALMLLVPLSFLPILSIIWVAILPHVFNLKTSLVLTALVVIAWFALYQWRWEEQHVFFSALLYSTFHLFYVFMNYETVKSEKATQEALRLNQELKATQLLLAESSRQNERTRIARDLHDLLGHHLTALSINLQVAQHLTEGEAHEKVSQCHSLAKLLLSDVREAVSSIRSNDSLQFEELINVTNDLFPNLSINKDIQLQFSLEQLEIAQTLLNCTQELVTNAVKHGRAEQVWLSLSRYKHTIVFEFYDDGQNAAEWQEGNGIKGMRERVSLIDGTLTIERKQLDSNNTKVITRICIPERQHSETA